MWNVAFVLFVILLIGLFSAQNMHQARINFPLLGGSDTPTIFLLLVCFFIGFAVATVMWSINFYKKGKKK